MACSERLAASCLDAAPVTPVCPVCDNAWPWSSRKKLRRRAFGCCRASAYAHALAKLVVFAEALCLLTTIRERLDYCTLPAIYRIAFSAERRVREAIRAGGLLGLVCDRRYEQVLTAR